MGLPERSAPGSHDLLRRFLAARVAAGSMPGASWWVGGDGRPVSRGAVGSAVVGRDAEPVDESTPFDLASLTKPLVTATLLVLLEQEGQLDLEASLGSVLSEAKGSPLGPRSLLSLATHTAGLAPWAPLFLRASSGDGYVAEILKQPPTLPAGRTLYSDLGYILLGVVLERATGRGLDALFDERIARPVGLVRTGFAAGGREFPDAAATERGNRYERALAGKAGEGHRWRDAIPRGAVHDGNAHGLGGVAGHAGLFGTADEVAQLAREILRPSVLPLDARARDRLLRVAPPSDGRTVGMVTAAWSSAGRGILPDDGPGHTGFTGTSLWLDVMTDRCYVLLTNRVHPRVPERDFRWVRRGFHRLAVRRLRGVA
jgi:CubicO group peptidase (beta-lactamase class C family)